MTALFADLVSSTALSDQHDPEVVRSVVSQFFERAIAEIRRFGGSAEQFRGDAIMAMFGLQQAHEDDPERAVRAAFAVLNALAELAPQAAERHGITLQARIGIESGEVVTGDPFGGSTMATGDVLNLAARLEEHAGPGQVMVGPVVHEATAGAVTYEPAGTHDIKGKAEPVAIWRAIEVRVEPGSHGPWHRRPHRPPHRARRGASTSARGRPPGTKRTEGDPVHDPGPARGRQEPARSRAGRGAPNR